MLAREHAKQQTPRIVPRAVQQVPNTILDISILSPHHPLTWRALETAQWRWLSRRTANSRCSKPVIDIAVGAESLEAGHAAIPALTALGYEFKGEAGIPGRHFFAKGSPEDRTHYVHVEPLNGELWRNHILFRDYLRCHADEVVVYAQLKRDQAKQFGDDRASYALAKDGYIERVLRAAEQEFELDASGRTIPAARIV